MIGIDKASLINGRKDLQLADALTKISPEAQKKTRAKAQEFEAMFLNSMFSQMTTGVKGEGPFGDTTVVCGTTRRMVATSGVFLAAGKMPP